MTPEWTFTPRLPFGITMPSPRAASVAVMGMLAFGVILGSAARPNLAGLPASALVLAEPHPNLLGSGGAFGGDTSGGATDATSASGGGGTVTVIVTETTPGGSRAGAANALSPVSLDSGITSPGDGGATGPGPNPFGLPPIHHVFLIMLSDEGFSQTFGSSTKDPYLAQLAGTGELIYNYYAVAASELANGIALLSGQGPTRQTEADCPTYSAIRPGTARPDHQVIGSGCVYPPSAQTLPGELNAKGLSWKAYVAGIDVGPPGTPTACRHPALGASDPYHVPRQGDSYVTWRNPVVYFSSLLKGTGCAKNDVGLETLASDLQKPNKAPALSYIVPSPCDDGSPQPCAPGAPAGLAPAESFLQTVLPEIEQSPAYRDNGLIAITFDQAPQTGDHADQSSCCANPTYPNLAGAARDLAGDPGIPAGTSTPTVSTPTTSTPGTPTPSTAAPTTSTTPTTTSTPTSPSPIPGGGGGQSKSTGGGGQVGLLLISRYVRKGSIDSLDYFNHFSLLATIEHIFDLKTLGYAADKTLPVFDPSVFNGHP